MRIYIVRLFLFFSTFLLSINTSLSAPVPQKLPDKPIDKSVRVKLHTGQEYCYSLAFVSGEGYIYIDDCKSSSAYFARYDLFQRVSWQVDGVFLCMTAPSSVTGIDGPATQNWDYLVIRPCVINDANQRWIIKNNSFYTADGRFRVKDYRWYAYISKKPDDYYDHTLSSTMDKWTRTIAAPGNISIKTSLGWKFSARSGFFMYYVSDNGSQQAMSDLYYNPDNGHIARYFPAAGLLSCMASKQSSSSNWDWVEWLYCKDTVSVGKDAGFWDISFLNGREGPILDRNGNFLRLTQYGSNWGVPYTAKANYLKGDTTNVPKSEFVLSYDIQRWNRYVSGNLDDTLAYCPAPGKKKTAARVKTRVKRSLPHDFKLTEEWRKRLYAIATTTKYTRTRSSGICGTCLLQTYQMIAELQEYFPRSPLSRGGYFFDTALGTDPMLSLQQRFPSLYNVMQNAPQVYGVPLTPSETSDAIAVRIASSTTQSVLPRFNWRMSSLATSHADILSAIRQLLSAPPGTVWVGLLSYRYPDGGLGRHALPIIRSASGLKVIPTNTSMSYFQFTDQASETTDPNLVLLRLSQGGAATVRSFATLQLIGVDQEPLSVVLSQNNCTGAGDGRRGSGQLPSSATVNQCASGRCSF